MAGLYSVIPLQFKPNVLYPLELHYAGGGKERILTLLIQSSEETFTDLNAFGSSVIENIQDTLKKITTASVVFSRICITDHSGVRHSLYQRGSAKIVSNARDAQRAARFTVQVRRKAARSQKNLEGRSVKNYKTLEVYIYSPKESLESSRVSIIERLFLEPTLLRVSEKKEPRNLAGMTKAESEAAVKQEKAEGTVYKETEFKIFPSVSNKNTFYEEHEVFSATFTGVIQMAERKRKAKQEDLV